MPNYGNYPNFGGFSQTFGVSAKIWGFYTLGTHYSCVYPNFIDLPKTCYLDVVKLLATTSLIIIFREASMCVVTNKFFTGCVQWSIYFLQSISASSELLLVQSRLISWMLIDSANEDSLLGRLVTQVQELILDGWGTEHAIKEQKTPRNMDITKRARCRARSGPLLTRSSDNFSWNWTKRVSRSTFQIEAYYNIQEIPPSSERASKISSTCFRYIGSLDPQWFKSTGSMPWTVPRLHDAEESNELSIW